MRRTAAAPRFLGLLREAFSADLARCVTEEIDEDLVHLDNREITQRLMPQKAPGNTARAAS